ncbi:MAG TPA: glycosyltransferase family 39 protein [Pirellulales bacterium]|nr:glycosyltransferase family 39 protein [Pirellulales bacterium]
MTTRSDRGDVPTRSVGTSGSPGLALALVIAALLFSTFVRLRLREFPLERDEGEYAYAGQLILEGIPPYRLAYNMKLPGTYLAYAGLMALFGQSTAGIHLGLLVVNLATIALLFLLGKDLFDPLSGAVGAVGFSVMSVSASVLGTAAHATHFVAFFGVAGAWLLWRAILCDGARLLCASGLLLGTALLMKQQGVFLPAFGACAVLADAAGRQGLSSRRAWKRFAFFLASAVLPYAATCLWLWQAGVFDKFWFWTVTYARQYVAQVPFERGIESFGRGLRDVVGPNWLIWLAAMLGAAGLFRPGGGTYRRRWFGFGFFIGSFLCVCPGLYFRQHYFIVLLPAVALFAGAGCGQVARFIGRATAPGGFFLRDPVATAILVAAWAYSIWPQRDFLFLCTRVEACRMVYGPNPFVESAAIADYLASHSAPGEYVAVIGSEPQLYFYSHRHSATGYIYTYPLMEPQPFARTMQEEMAAEITAREPEFIVLVHVSTSWLERPDSDRFIFGWTNGYLASSYEPVGLVDILSQHETLYRWDDQALGARPRSPYHVWIFKRKS